MAFWQLTRLRVVYPVVLLVLLFADGSVMAGLGGLFTAFPWHVLPTLTLVWLFYGVQFRADLDMPFWVYTGIIGLLFDMYYTGIFGAYTVAFLIATIVMRQLQQYLDERLLSAMTIFLIGLVVYLLITYFAGAVIGLANVGLTVFFLYQVLPTLLLNTVIAAIGYYPVWSLFQFLR